MYKLCMGGRRGGQNRIPSRNYKSVSLRWDFTVKTVLKSLGDKRIDLGIFFSPPSSPLMSVDAAVDQWRAKEDSKYFW